MNLGDQKNPQTEEKTTRGVTKSNPLRLFVDLFLWAALIIGLGGILKLGWKLFLLGWSAF